MMMIMVMVMMVSVMMLMFDNGGGVDDGYKDDDGKDVGSGGGGDHPDDDDVNAGDDSERDDGSDIMMMMMMVVMHALWRKKKTVGWSSLRTCSLSSGPMFQVLPSISVSLFFVRGNVPSAASHFSLLVFQGTHAEWLPRDSNLSTHGAGLCQLLPHAGLHDIQRLALSCHHPWCWTALFLLWLAESHGH